MIRESANHRRPSHALFLLRHNLETPFSLSANTSLEETPLPRLSSSTFRPIRNFSSLCFSMLTWRLYIYSHEIDAPYYGHSSPSSSSAVHVPTLEPFFPSPAPPPPLPVFSGTEGHRASLSEEGVRIRNLLSHSDHPRGNHRLRGEEGNAEKTKRKRKKFAVRLGAADWQKEQ